MTRAALIAVAIGACSAVQAQTPFEEPPVLEAAAILKPDYVAGPLHHVKESVPTRSGANRFTIVSEFGVFQADGNAMLETRVTEIGALAKIREMSKSDEYAKALANAARAPIDFAERLATDPGKTVADVPKGAFKLLGRIGSGVKEAVEGKGGSKEDTAKSALGMEAIKRRLAVELGVDPYSTNPVLQKALDEVAWASFAGGATLKVLLMPIGGGVVTAAKVASTGAEMQQVLAESTPSELRGANLEKLTGMKVPPKDVEAFLGNPAVSPSRQTAIVATLVRLDGVQGRDAFVRAAAESAEHEADAVFWQLTAVMIADRHARGPALDRIVLLEGGFPLAIAKDGGVVVALHWDYACWTPLSSRFAEAVRRLGSGEGPSLLVTISGVASPTLRKELEAQGFRVEDRAVPGPLK